MNTTTNKNTNTNLRVVNVFALIKGLCCFPVSRHLPSSVWPLETRFCINQGILLFSFLWTLSELQKQKQKYKYKQIPNIRSSYTLSRKIRTTDCDISELKSRADKNFKAELGIIFDCLGGTEKKVRKSRHFAKKLHQCLYFYKKARKSRHFAKKTHKCCQKVPGQIKVLGN